MHKTDEIEKILGGQLVNIVEETQNEQYNGITFEYDGENYRFRSGKITPKKKGAFVVMWKKDVNNKNEPYHVDNFPDYLLVLIDGDECGYFLFPKLALVENKIISQDAVIGKMGFRVYAPSEDNLNATAKKTQTWQQFFYKTK